MLQLFAFIGGFVTALFAEPIRQWLFRSRLVLDFAKSDHFVTRTKESGGHEATYIRVRAVNRSARLAKSCRAYLVNIERQGKSGAWESTEYCESLQLAWSGRGDGAHQALDLPTDVPHFIDVVSTRAISKTFLPALSNLLFRYAAVIESTGTFRFTVLVSGDNVKPVKIQLVFVWTGVWDAFTVDQA